MLPGLETRQGQEVALDALVAEYRPDVIHVHNVANPAVLEWASARRGALATLQDHRFFCPGRGKWTLAGDVCRQPLSSVNCADCFKDDGYFQETLALTERRLQALRRLRVSVLSRYMREELVAAGVPAASVHVVPPFIQGSTPTRSRTGRPACCSWAGWPRRRACARR